MDSQALLQLLQLLPNLAVPIANLIRELLNASGYNVDRLLSAGTSLNAQTLTHVEMEINRVKGLIPAQKGGDPESLSVKIASAKIEVEPEPIVELVVAPVVEAAPKATPAPPTPSPATKKK